MLVLLVPRLLGPPDFSAAIVNSSWYWASIFDLAGPWLPQISLAEKQPGNEGKFTPRKATLNSLPVLWGDNSGEWFHAISEKVPRGTESPCSLNGNELINTRFTGFSPCSVSLLPLPLLPLPAIAWQINYLLSVACPSLCFWKNPN